MNKIIKKKRYRGCRGGENRKRIVPTPYKDALLKNDVDDTVDTEVVKKKSSYIIDIDTEHTNAVKECEKYNAIIHGIYGLNHSKQYWSDRNTFISGLTNNGGSIKSKIYKIKNKIKKLEDKANITNITNMKKYINMTIKDRNAKYYKPKNKEDENDRQILKDMECANCMVCKRKFMAIWWIVEAFYSIGLPKELWNIILEYNGIHSINWSRYSFDPNNRITPHMRYFGFINNYSESDINYSHIFNIYNQPRPQTIHEFKLLSYIGPLKVKSNKAGDEVWINHPTRKIFVCYNTSCIKIYNNIYKINSNIKSIYDMLNNLSRLSYIAKLRKYDSSLNIPKLITDKKTKNTIAIDIRNKYTYLQLDPSLYPDEDSQLIYRRFAIYKWIPKSLRNKYRFSTRNHIEIITKIKELTDKLDNINPRILSKDSTLLKQNLIKKLLFRRTDDSDDSII